MVAAMTGRDAVSGSTVPNPNAGRTLCAHCRRWREPGAELVVVERIATGIRRVVCREPCFRRAVGPKTVDRIISESEDPR